MSSELSRGSLPFEPSIYEVNRLITQNPMIHVPIQAIRRGYERVRPWEFPRGVLTGGSRLSARKYYLRPQRTATGFLSKTRMESSRKYPNTTLFNWAIINISSSFGGPGTSHGAQTCPNSTSVDSLGFQLTSRTRRGIQ